MPWPEPHLPPVSVRCHLPLPGPAVINHGVPEELVEQAFEANRRYFSLRLEQKMLIAADGNNRGYTPFQEETLDPEGWCRRAPGTR